MRPNFRERSYSAEWDALAKRFLSACPYCWGCASIGVEARAVLIDHIVPVADVPQRLLDPDNMQPLCKHCHDVVKRQLERRWKRGEIGADDLRMGTLVAIATVRRFHRPAIGADGFAIPGT
jgi:hypothetical protein